MNNQSRLDRPIFQIRVDQMLEFDDPAITDPAELRRLCILPDRPFGTVDKVVEFTCQAITDPALVKEPDPRPPAAPNEPTA